MGDERRAKTVYSTEPPLERGSVPIPNQYETLLRIRNGELALDPLVVARYTHPLDHLLFQEMVAGLRVLRPDRLPESNDDVRLQLAATIRHSNRSIHDTGGITPLHRLLRITERMSAEGLRIYYEEVEPHHQRILHISAGMAQATLNVGWQEKGHIPKKDEGTVARAAVNTPIHLIFGSPQRYGVIEVATPEELNDYLTEAQQMIQILMSAYGLEYGNNYAYPRLSFVVPNLLDGKAHTLKNTAGFFMQLPRKGTLPPEQGKPSGKSEPTQPATTKEKEIDPTSLYRRFTPEEISSFPLMSEVAGQRSAVSEMERISLGFQYPQTIRDRGATLPKGVVIEGPPGTGKTMLAQAFAREVGGEIIQVTVADIMSKWVGDAERGMKLVFEEAQRIHKEAGKLVVIVFDEMDALISDRGAKSTHEVSQKVISVFLSMTSGFMSHDGAYFIVGTTNRPDAIDSAATRSGRVAKKIVMGLPDTPGLMDILTVHLNRAISRATPESGIPPIGLISSHIDLARLAAELQGASGADVEAVVVDTLFEKTVQEILHHKTNGSQGYPWTPLCEEELIATWNAKKTKALQVRQRLAFATMQ